MPEIPFIYDFYLYLATCTYQYESIINKSMYGYNYDP